MFQRPYSFINCKILSFCWGYGGRSGSVTRIEDKQVSCHLFPGYTSLMVIFTLFVFAGNLILVYLAASSSSYSWENFGSLDSTRIVLTLLLSLNKCFLRKSTKPLRICNSSENFLNSISKYSPIPSPSTASTQGLIVES